MRCDALCAMALSALLPLTSQATAYWSSCVTVTAVTSEPNQSQVLVTLAGSGIGGCSAGNVTGAVYFTVGQSGITSSDGLDQVLAAGLTALGIGRQVQIYYDNATSNCYSNSLSVGGYLGGC